MMRFRQHRPAYIDIGEPDIFDFGTVEELLAYPYVRAFRADDYMGDGAFHRYSLSRHDGIEALLMAEYDGGRHWWVIGHIDDVSNLDLPEWCPVRDVPCAG